MHAVHSSYTIHFTYDVRVIWIYITEKRDETAYIVISICMRSTNVVVVIWFFVYIWLLLYQRIFRVIQQHEIAGKPAVVPTLHSAHMNSSIYFQFVFAGRPSATTRHEWFCEYYVMWSNVYDVPASSNTTNVAEWVADAVIVLLIRRRQAMLTTHTTHMRIYIYALTGTVRCCLLHFIHCQNSIIYYGVEVFCFLFLFIVISCEICGQPMRHNLNAFQLHIHTRNMLLTWDCP